MAEACCRENELRNEGDSFYIPIFGEQIKIFPFFISPYEEGIPRYVFSKKIFPFSKNFYSFFSAPYSFFSTPYSFFSTPYSSSGTLYSFSSAVCGK